MPVGSAEVDRRVAEMSAALRAHGLRLTRQRVEVIRQIAATEEHPDVETLFRGVRGRVPNISLDTVYRTLAVLVSCGLVDRVMVSAGPTRYDSNMDQHHHFVCMRCGSIHDIDSAELDKVGALAHTEGIGVVDTVQVQLRGICAACGSVQAPGGESPAGEEGVRR